MDYLLIYESLFDRAAMKLMGIKLNNEEVEIMIMEADQDGDHKINLQEFSDVVMGQVREFQNRNSSICLIL